jgi:DNA polymerase-3 subunit epsilon
LHFDPERDIDFGATEVHGKTWEDLKGRPRFRDRMQEVVEFLHGAEWIIHNAPFDIAFIEASSRRKAIPDAVALYAGVIDTLAMARDSFPWQAQQPRCAVRALRRVERAPHAARRAARRPASWPRSTSR